MAVPCSQRSSGSDQITESIKIAERTHCLPSILCLSVRKAEADSGRNRCCERKLNDYIVHKYPVQEYLLFLQASVH